MKAKVSKKSKFAAWVRIALLTNPTITLDALRQAFAKSKLPQYFKVMPANVTAGWQELKERWGIISPSDVPQYHGELNVSSMIRLYLDMHGMDKTESEALAFFEEDGIKLRTNVFPSVKSVYAKKAKAEGTVRVKVKGTKTKRRRKSKARVSEALPHNNGEVSTSESYEQIEEALDNLLVVAGKLNNHPLFADLRTARRRASAAILS